MKPLVSILILNWNGKEILQECISSVLKTTYKPIEVLVVDNCSTDDSDKIVTLFSDVVLIRNSKNYGYAKGNNVGFKHASGKYIVTLNNDMVVDQDWLNDAVRLLETDLSSAVISCRQMNYFKPEIIDSLFHYPEKTFTFTRMGRGEMYGDIPFYALPCYVFAANGGSAIYRKSVIDKYGGFEESFFAYYDEIDLCMKFFINGWKCLYSPNSVVYHKDGASFNKISKQKYFFSERNRIWFIFRYYPLRIIIESIISIAVLELRTLKYLFFLNFTDVYLKSRYIGFFGMLKFLKFRIFNVQKFLLFENTYQLFCKEKRIPLSSVYIPNNIPLGGINDK